MRKKGERIHFMGIGGVGMSGLALLLKEMGYEVDGCDLSVNKYVSMLKAKGIRVYRGHSVNHLEGKDGVVYSSAIPKDNPELLYAKEKGIPVVPRAQMLAKVMSSYPKSVVVSGSHGKTTTTSMISEILLDLGLEPTIVVGGIVRNLGTHYYLGKGDFLVAEGDESDGSFLYYEPFIEVITNIDKEHLNFYADFEAVKKAFVNFINRCSSPENVVVCGDDKGVREAIDVISGPFLTYGFEEGNILRGEIKDLGLYPRVDVFFREKFLGTFTLGISGKHNVLNALGAIGVSILLELDLERVFRVLSRFKGAGRRLEFKGIFRGAMFFDDYGHHPTEIKATLDTIKEMYPDKKVCLVFQPHRYSRVSKLWEEFLLSLKTPEILVLTEIYSAGEKPVEGVSGKKLFETLKILREPFPTFFVPREENLFDGLEKILEEITEKNMIVIVMGAGDIYKIFDYLFKKGLLENEKKRVA